MKLKCKRCKHEWEYTGKKKAHGKWPVIVKCTKCGTSVKLEEKKEDE